MMLYATKQTIKELNIPMPEGGARLREHILMG